MSPTEKEIEIIWDTAIKKACSKLNIQICIQMHSVLFSRLLLIQTKKQKQNSYAQMYKYLNTFYYRFFFSLFPLPANTWASHKVRHFPCSGRKILTYCPLKALNSNVHVTPAGMSSMMAALLKNTGTEKYRDTAIKKANSILHTEYFCQSVWRSTVCVAYLLNMQFPLCSFVNLGVSTEECVTKIR